MMRTVDVGRPGQVEVVLIAGRSGVGKTSVALEISARLRALGLAHCHIEGDNLDAAYPKPVDDPHGTKLTEANLRAVWGNYAGLGHRRLIYVNTVSILERDLIVRSVGGTARVIGVLLTSSDEIAYQRLARRESGHAHPHHVERGRRMAGLLRVQAPEGTHHVTTDDRTVDAVAIEVLRLSGWAVSSPDSV